MSCIRKTHYNSARAIPVCSTVRWVCKNKSKPNISQNNETLLWFIPQYIVHLEQFKAVVGETLGSISAYLFPDLPYGRTGYCITRATSGRTLCEKKRRKCRICRLGVEFLGNCSTNDYHISESFRRWGCHINVLDMTSLICSCRLQNVTEYCIKYLKWVQLQRVE